MDESAQKEEQLDLPTDLPKELSAGEFEEEFDTYPKTLLSWSAPGRPYRKRGKQFFATATLLVVLVEIILFLFSQYLLMLVVFSLLFLSFSLAIVPPRNFHYRISTEGVTVEDHSYLWQELYDFYFKRRDTVDVLIIRTRAIFPGELSITLESVDQNHVRQIMLPYLPYREVIKPTFVEKSANWMVKTFPLEKPTA